MLTKNHGGLLTSAWVQSSESLKASNSTPAERIYGMLSSVWGLHSVRQEEWKSAKHQKKTFNHSSSFNYASVKSSRSPSRQRSGQRIPSSVMVTHAVQTSDPAFLSLFSFSGHSRCGFMHREKEKSWRNRSRSTKHKRLIPSSLRFSVNQHLTTVCCSTRSANVQRLFQSER